MNSPASLPPLSVSSTSMLIAVTRRYIKQVLRARLASHDLTPYQAWMLVLIREVGPQCLTDLAAHMGMDHPTASRLAHGLQSRGFLKVRPHPEKGRRVLIELDSRKSKELEAICRLVATYRQDLEAGIPPEERAVFTAVLGKLLVNLNGMWDAEGRPSGSERD